jgi:hypothetical protein
MRTLAGPLASERIGQGTDGATFNPATMEAFSSNRDGTLTVIKQNSPTSFTGIARLSVESSGSRVTHFTMPSSV